MNLFVFEKSVGAIIFRLNEAGEKEFLLTQYRSGHWDFPRGKIEKNESEEETLKREVKEEVGLVDLKIMPGFRKTMWIYYRAKGEEREKRLANGRGINIIKKVIIYLAQTQTKDIELSFENLDHVWLTEKEAFQKITFANPRKIFQKAQSFLS